MRQDLKMMGHDGSGNILAPSLTLHLDYILEEFPENRRKEESSQVTFLMLRKVSEMRKLYNYYCSIGHNRVQSNKSELTRLQFWRFILDSHIHHHQLSLPDIDRILAKCLKKDTVHQPLERISLAEFLSSLAILGYILYKDKIKSNSSSSKSSKDPKTASTSRSTRSSYVLSQCLLKLINDHIMMYSGRVKGGFLYEPRRNVNALKYMEGSWKVFRSLCEPKSTSEPTVVMRKLLLALTRFQIVGQRLSSEKFLNILAADHPNVNQHGDYNLEIEMTFLEYFEVLLECAVTYVQKEDVEHQLQIHAQGPRRVRSERSSASTGIGHPRPGSAISKRSVRSARSLSSQSSISSIGESEEDIGSGSDETVTQSEIEVGSQASTQIERLSVSEESLHTTPPITGATPPPTFAQLGDNPNETAKSGRSSPEVITAEMQEKEKQFTLWAHQLKIFFTRHLFPAWHREETLKREAARHRQVNKRTK